MRTKTYKFILLEIILSIFIFMVCAMVCTMVIVRAQQLSRQSSQLTDAVYLAQSAAERWKAGAAPEELENGAYVVSTIPIPDINGVQTARITVSVEDTLIYEIDEVVRT